MKLIKQASGKTTIKVSQLEWYGLGKEAGWTTASEDDFFAQQLQNIFDTADSGELKTLIANLQRDRRGLMGKIRAIDEKIRMLENGVRPPDFSGLSKGRLPF